MLKRPLYKLCISANIVLLSCTTPIGQTTDAQEPINRIITGPAGPEGERGPQGAAGPQGDRGPAGPRGRNYSSARRLFGSGIDGDLNVLADENDEVDFEVGEHYHNIYIQAGATLYVRSGTVIRCTGSFTNEGRVIVTAPGRPGIRYANEPRDGWPELRIPHPGIARASAGFGSVEFAPPFERVLGGQAGVGARDSAMELIRIPRLIVGGAGAGSDSPNGLKASGGGGVHIRCQETIRNAGLIDASGGYIADRPSAEFYSAPAAGTGGGGGGAVVLVSNVDIDNSEGEITVQGGDGGIGTDSIGAGGGGGGGCIYFVSPAIETGTLNLKGGNVSEQGTFTSETMAVGGGGGGASCGNGGKGQEHSSSGVFNIPAQQGLTGSLFVTEELPEHIF